MLSLVTPQEIIRVKLSPDIDRKLKELETLLEPAKNDIDNLFSKYVDPLLEMSIESSKRFLDENALSASVAQSQILANVFSRSSLKDVVDLNLEAMKILNVEMERIGVIYSKNILNNFKEAVQLEIGNEAYLINNFTQFMPTGGLFSIMESNDVDYRELEITSSKLYLTVFALYKGIFSAKQELEPILSGLSKLCLQFAEEKDTLITTLDILLNKDKREGLDRAIMEFKETVERAS